MKLPDHVSNHLQVYVATSILGFIGVVFWGGVTGYLDTRHIQRQEHSNAIEAIRLEARCHRYHERIALLEARIGGVNREQSKLRNYIRSSEPTDRVNQARADTIADLDAERAALQRQISKLTEPTGCADE